MILEHNKAVVWTGLAIVILVGTYARIALCSGFAMKRSIDVGVGVADANYHDKLGVIFINNSDGKFCVQQRDRIAQLILENTNTLPVEEVSGLDDNSQ